MTTKSVEERLNNLEEHNRRLEAKNKELEHEIERAQAVSEIANLMARYEYMKMVGMYSEMETLYATKTPGVRAEFERMGVYEGITGIRKILTRDKNIEGDRVGVMTMNILTMPVIVVAGDGKTAQGVWVSPGIVTTAREGKGQAGRRWSRFGADFVKEDGKWKIWHLHVYGLFMTSIDRSWAEPAPTAPPPPPEGEERPAMPEIPDDMKADRPNTYSWDYSTTAVMEYVPRPPEPYETWDESMAYVPEA